MEEFDYLNNNLKELIIKFEDNLSKGKDVFFDSEEIVDIIDYYFDTNQKSKIRSSIALAQNLYPNDTEVIIRKAQYISISKNPERAIAFLEKYKTDAVRQESSLIFALAKLYSQAGMNEKAIETYKYVLEIDKEYIEVYHLLGEEYIVNKDYEEAVKHYQKLLTEEPDDEFALTSYAYAAQFLDDTDTPIQFLKNLCKQNSFSEQNWIAYGLLLYYLENYYDAITAFDLAIAIEDQDTTAHIYKGQSLISLANYDAGIISLEDALKITPREPVITYFLGKAYEKQNKYKKAITYYKRCLKYDKNSTEPLTSLAMCYFEINEFALGEPYIKKAIEIDPKNVYNRLSYAEMLYKEGYIDQAEELYQTLYDEGEELAAVTINWALSMVANKRLMDAIHLLRETIDANKFEEPSVYFILIEIASKEPYLRNHLEDYLFKLFLEFDVSLEMLKEYCPSLLENPIYETLIKTYIDEKD
mgnify:CR=1 FL=1|jgi:tetratricopeptide (TPR) repeat protein